MPAYSFVGLPVADREVQRILLELLNQMDGFDQNVNVKVRRLGMGWTSRSWAMEMVVDLTAACLVLQSILLVKGRATWSQNPRQLLKLAVISAPDQFYHLRPEKLDLGKGRLSNLVLCKGVLT